MRPALNYFFMFSSGGQWSLVPKPSVLSVYFSRESRNTHRSLSIMAANGNRLR